MVFLSIRPNLFSFTSKMRVISFDCLLVTVQISDNVVDKPGRVLLLNSNGECIYDKYIYWKDVINFRSYETGILPEHIARGKLLKNIQKDISLLIKGCLLVGHFVKFHLRGLGLSHPYYNIRDTASYGPFVTLTQNVPNPLRILAFKVLGTHIQCKRHDCYENAITSLELYKKVIQEWEDQVENGEYSESMEEDLEEEDLEEEDLEEEDLDEEFSDEFSAEEIMAVALKCETVVVDHGEERRLKPAWVSLVDDEGNTIYNEYIYVKNVTDYITHITGIQPHHLASGKPLSVVKQEVSDLIRGCLLVGYLVHADLKLLGLCHPESNIRDVTKYPRFVQFYVDQTPSLKSLALSFLNMQIQSYRHRPVEDAFACMMLYRKVSAEWEDMLEN